jgi:hypothetical protein
MIVLVWAELTPSKLTLKSFCAVLSAYFVDMYILVLFTYIHSIYEQIQDDDDSPPQTVKGDDELSKQLAQGGDDDAGDALPHVFSPSAELPSSDDSSADRFSGPVIIHSINAETANDVRTLIFEKLVHREGDDSYCWSGKNV